MAIEICRACGAPASDLSRVCEFCGAELAISALAKDELDVTKKHAAALQGLVESLGAATTESWRERAKLWSRAPVPRSVVGIAAQFDLVKTSLPSQEDLAAGEKLVEAGADQVLYANRMKHLENTPNPVRVFLVALQERAKALQSALAVTDAAESPDEREPIAKAFREIEASVRSLEEVKAERRKNKRNIWRIMGAFFLGMSALLVGGFRGLTLLTDSFGERMVLVDSANGRFERVSVIHYDQIAMGLGCVVGGLIVFFAVRRWLVASLEIDAPAQSPTDT